MERRARTHSAVPGWAKLVITLVVVVGSGVLVYTQLPKGAFPTDLSRIGQGTPALVVARDISFVAGAEVMDLLNTVRPEFGDRVAFLAVNLGNPHGQSFARQHGMRDGTVVLFAADGRRVAAMDVPRTQAQVRELLATVDVR